MKASHLNHLRRLRPAPELDVLGQWMHVPNAKTGHTSTQTGMFNHRMIVRHRGRRNWDRVWDQLFVPKIDTIVIYTFVRNPWDRVLSAFMYCQQGDRTNSPNRIDTKWTFTDYVKKVLAVRGPSVNVHFRTQHETYWFKGETIPEVFVGRFERLNEDWAKVADRVGVSRDLPWLNASKHEHYTTYYDSETRDIIGQMYQTEITLLEYEFGE